MEQTELLWQYQEADMAADALESEIKRSPARLALKKNREFLVEQQNAVKRMEEEVAEMVDRVDVIKVAITRMEEQLGTLTKRMQDAPPSDLAQAQEMAKDAQRLLGDLSGFEQEMQRIQQDAADRDRQEKDIRVKYAKVKAEYDQQKIEYEALYKEQMKGLDEKRAAAEAKTKDIEPALLAKYQQIKQHCSRPVAKLYGDQCGGCNMNLPQASLRSLKNGNKITECENCGRMLIQM
ncbi:MAG: C4-type zinc ribbon domain-containing protein [Eubacteriales bacterium]|nr:C4-type zinc ribbon domain-containing protein [Eubacteriales bacterium]